MAYIVQTDSALKFKFDRWMIAVFAYNAPDIGVDYLVMGHGNDDDGYTGDTILFQGDLVAACNAVHGMGNFLVPMIPAMNAYCKALYNTHPIYAPETNATPPSIVDLNITLFEYFKAEPSADGTYPVISLKPYP